jgi:hypothetical protein
VRQIHYLHHAALLNSGLGLFSIVEFPSLHRVPSLADVTMKAKACAVGQKRHTVSDVTMETRASSLLMSKEVLKALLASCIKDLWISFESLGKFG